MSSVYAWNQTLPHPLISTNSKQIDLVFSDKEGIAKNKKLRPGTRSMSERLEYILHNRNVKINKLTQKAKQASKSFPPVFVPNTKSRPAVKSDLNKNIYCHLQEAVGNHQQ